MKEIEDTRLDWELFFDKFIQVSFINGHDF